MAERPLSRVLGNIELCTKLQNLGVLTCSDLLNISSYQLMHMVSITLEEVESTKNEVSSAIMVNPQTCLSAFRKALVLQKISSGIEMLDQVTRGGIALGRITEISGPPGSGKTHFCIGCSIQYLRHNPHAKVIYLDSEMKFDPKRFFQIAVERLVSSSADAGLATSFLNRMQIQRVEDVNQLRSAIEGLQLEVAASECRLIIVDSIAAVTHRSQIRGADLDSLLLSIASELKIVAEKCSTAVLCTNQVTSSTAAIGRKDPSQQLGKSAIMLNSYGGQLIPALGDVWQQCVTTRLLLQPSLSPVSFTSSFASLPYHDVVRGKVVLQKSSDVATGISVRYAIKSCGICDDNEND